MNSSSADVIHAQGLEQIWGPRMLSVLRLVTGLIFLEHGAQKLLGFPPGMAHQPGMLSLAWFSGVLELVGGALVFLGFFPRPIAFLLSGEMAFAYWMVHAQRGPYPVTNGGDAAILFCFVFLYISVAGAGCWSVDRAMRRGG